MAIADEPFDPHHLRYYHTCCLGAHVTTASRYIAYASLFFTCFRYVIGFAFGFDFWGIISSLHTGIELICVGILFLAVYNESFILTFPFICMQIFDMTLIIALSLFNMNDVEVAQLYVIRFIWFTLIMYSLKVMRNFHNFLAYRELWASECQNHGVHYQVRPQNQYQNPEPVYHQPPFNPDHYAQSPENQQSPCDPPPPYPRTHYSFNK